MFRYVTIGEKGQKGTKERSGASFSSPSRSSFFEFSLSQDLPTGFAKEDKSRFSLGQDLPRRTNFAEEDKLPAEWDQLLWPHDEIACNCYNFYADSYWNNPWDCFPLIVSAADITGPTIKFDIFGKVQIESTLHLILTILFQSHNQSFYQLCKTSFILLRKNFWCCSSRVVS